MFYYEKRMIIAWRCVWIIYILCTFPIGYAIVFLFFFCSVLITMLQCEYYVQDVNIKNIIKSGIKTNEHVIANIIFCVLLLYAKYYLHLDSKTIYIFLFLNCLFHLKIDKISTPSSIRFVFLRGLILSKYLLTFVLMWNKNQSIYFWTLFAISQLRFTKSLHENDMFALLFRELKWDNNKFQLSLTHYLYKVIFPRKKKWLYSKEKIERKLIICYKFLFSKLQQLPQKIEINKCSVIKHSVLSLFHYIWLFHYSDILIIEFFYLYLFAFIISYHDQWFYAIIDQYQFSKVHEKLDINNLIDRRLLKKAFKIDKRFHKIQQEVNQFIKHKDISFMIAGYEQQYLVDFDLQSSTIYVAY